LRGRVEVIWSFGAVFRAALLRVSCALRIKKTPAQDVVAHPRQVLERGRHGS